MVVQVENPEELKKELTSKVLVLYGMGTIGVAIAQWCDTYAIEYVFADKNAIEKQESTHQRVITPEILLADYKDANIVISTNLYFDEIKADLQKKGFSENQILSYKLFVPQMEWRDLEGNIDWDLMCPSVELISRWIPESTKSVADYGAGQMYLKTFLHPKITYYPVDYFKRFPQTVVCDLNTGSFPDLSVDISVLNGVLEFLTTAETLLQHVCRNTSHRILLSYMTTDRFADPIARRTSGYVSDLSEETIISLLRKANFQLLQKVPDQLDSTDTIYLFEKQQAGTGRIS